MTARVAQLRQGDESNGFVALLCVHDLGAAGGAGDPP